jgi:hypothetical protein
MAASWTTAGSMRPEAGLCLLLLAVAATASADGLDAGGLTKLNLLGATYPDDSVIRDAVGASSLDVQGEFRLNLEWRKGGFGADAAYQLFALAGDTLDLGAGLPPGVPAVIPRLPNDDRRLFDFSSVISESSDHAVLHRLDRLWVGHSGDRHVLRFGRQALTWGNGLFYAPMDLVNPFDPSTIDTEYKFGDDMLYGQYLRESGDDIQSAVVIRRNTETGDVEYEQATVALKYHGFSETLEYDLLLAEHYDEWVLGVGGGRDVGGAVIRADLVLSETSDDIRAQFVANLSYSWTFAGRNMSGALEYYFNGFGQAGGDYSTDSLAANPELLARVARGQLFTLGRHYAAASVLVEMTPLWTVTPVMLVNIGDPSALLQLTTQYSLGDNLALLGSFNLPFGASGTEFGGIDTPLPGRYLSSGPGAFVQIAWYF